MACLWMKEPLPSGAATRPARARAANHFSREASRKGVIFVGLCKPYFLNSLPYGLPKMKVATAVPHTKESKSLNKCQFKVCAHCTQRQGLAKSVQFLLEMGEGYDVHFSRLSG